MNGLTAGDILARLGPGSPPGLIWNIFLYIIFILAVVTMFMQSDKQNSTTLMMGAVGACAVLAKLNVFPAHNLGSLLVNVLMFVLPLIVAGIAINKKSVPLAIFTSLLSGIFFFGFWFLIQRS
jgi:hypothetical protein